MSRQCEHISSEPRDEPIALGLDMEFEIDAAPIRVTPGHYAAECLKITKVDQRQWHRTYLQLRFRLRGIGPENHVILPGFVNVPKKGKLSPYSKLGRWARIIAAYTGGRADRVTMKAFGQFLFTVKVETVTKANSKDDRKPFTLPEAAQYEIVSEILDIVGRLALRTGQQ